MGGGKILKNSKCNILVNTIIFLRPHYLYFIDQHRPDTNGCCAINCTVLRISQNLVRRLYHPPLIPLLKLPCTVGKYILFSNYVTI